MSSINNKGFFNSRVICDSLSVWKNAGDKLFILVVGVSSTSTDDINRLVGNGSNTNVLVGDVRINCLTSSEVAGSKHVKGHFISGGGINSVLWLSGQNINRIFSILSTKKVEKRVQRYGRSVESGIDGIAFLCRILFTVAHNLFGFFSCSCICLRMYCHLSLAINLLHRSSCLEYFTPIHPRAAHGALHHITHVHWTSSFMIIYMPHISSLGLLMAPYIILPVVTGPVHSCLFICHTYPA